MAEKLLEVKDLHVEYITDDGPVYAVNGIDFSVSKRETLGLVGETGAGKTTTALSILKLLPEKVGSIKQGSILLDGTDIIHTAEKDMRTIRGNVASMIFQDPMTSLNPTFTVGEQIAEVVALHKTDFTKEQVNARVDEMMRLVGLPQERKSEFPHQFSGGMKQRVVIAMALACDPKIILADEPTTALDVTIQAQVLKMMRNLKEQFDTAMILITHDLGVVAETCDNVAIMYAGEIIEIGTVEDIFEADKHHPYTTGLFGSIPDMTKEERRLHPIDGLMPDPTCKIEGCAFCERCPQRMEICETVKPTAFADGTHSIKCHLFK